MIVNAVAHRDYTSNGSVQIMLFKDRIEVINPGVLPLGWTIEKLKSTHASIPANPLLAEPMYLKGYIERLGTGTLDIIRISMENNLKEPEFEQIISWIDRIGEKGALERYFRPEGRQRDDVWAIPIETSKLRLYLIRLSENIVILGNGGIKTTRTYNEDEALKGYVELLQSVNRFINSRIKNGKVQVLQKQLFGSLNFYLQKGDGKK